MSSFCPVGYAPVQRAIVEAAEYWFSAEIETAAAASTPTMHEPKTGVEALAAALSRPQIPEAARQAYTDILLRTEERLRQSLHQGKVTAYHFGGFFSHGRNAVRSNFWAGAAADGVLMSGTYYPFGKPTRWYDRPLGYPIFFQQAELAALLSEQEQIAKRQLPESKKSELAAALLKLDYLPNRAEQFKALRELPEFHEYRVTDAVLREAAKEVPRRAGRSRKQ